MRRLVATAAWLRRAWSRAARIWLPAVLGLLVACAGAPAAPTATPPPSDTPAPTLPIGVNLATRQPPTAAVIQITPSPLPTATPTATPTPIVYVIEEGDTLLAIALRTFTTVDDIRSLNPGLNPNLLQIGQAVILPPPATPVFGAAGHTPIPLDVAVTAVELYGTPTGGLWIVGELHNRGPRPVENIQVQIDLLADDGAPLGQVMAWSQAAVIAAGGRAPFGTLLAAPPAGLAYPVAAIVGGNTVVDAGSRILDLAVTATAVTIEEDRARITGAVVNESEWPAIQVTLLATLYDSDGRIVGFQQQALDGVLAPGAEAPFTISSLPPGGQPARAVVTVEGLRAAE